MEQQLQHAVGQRVHQLQRLGGVLAHRSAALVLHAGVGVGDEIQQHPRLLAELRVAEDGGGKLAEHGGQRSGGSAVVGETRGEM